MPEGLRELLEEPWQPVGTAGLVATSIGFGAFFLVGKQLLA